jgi:hypothetical protein
VSDAREGFLARWSRRKARVASPAAEPRDAAAATPAATVPPQPLAAVAPPAGVADAATPAPAEPPPTLADVAALTRDSDFARFMAPGVDGAVRNAAMKKLFADPQFNVMDGLDVYIDDYNTPDPLPFAMLRQLRQSELLGLFSDEAAPAAAAAPAATAAGASPDNRNAAAPPSPPAAATTTDASPRAEDDPDLRLQPDDGDRRPGAGEGPRA